MRSKENGGTMFGKNKKKKQEVEAMKAQEAANASKGTETPAGAAQEQTAPQETQSAPHVDNNQQMQPRYQQPGQGMNQGMRPQTQQGMPPQGYGQPQGFGAPTPQNGANTQPPFGPQGYNQSHQPQQRMNQAPQSGMQGVPNQAPNQWGQPAPQGWNQGPQPQNMQRQQQWGGPQSMPPRQGMQSQRPEMVSHPAPAQMNQPEAEKTPSENKFSFNDFHQRDNQTKQQDFSYGIDPSMSQPKEFKFGPAPQVEMQSRPLSQMENPHEERHVEQHSMERPQEPQRTANLETHPEAHTEVHTKVHGQGYGAPVGAQPQGFPSRQTTRQGQPFAQPQQAPQRPQYQAPIQEPARPEPRPAQPAPEVGPMQVPGGSMFVPGFEAPTAPVVEEVPEPVQTPQEEDAYMEVMNNVHTGTKVEYRSNPEPTQDEVVYQPEIKASSQTASHSVEHEAHTDMYSYTQPETEKAEVQPEQSIENSWKTPVYEGPTATIEDLKTEEKIEESDEQEPATPVVYEDILKEKEAERLDLNEFKGVFDSEKKEAKSAKPANPTRPQNVKMDRAPDEKGRVFKSKKERERERQIEEERAARERARAAKEAKYRAEHPDLKCSKEVEAYLVYELVKSMNKGNCGVVKTRCEMAKAQLEDLVKMGYDLEDLFDYLTGRK